MAQATEHNITKLSAALDCRDVDAVPEAVGIVGAPGAVQLSPRSIDSSQADACQGSAAVREPITGSVDYSSRAGGSVNRRSLMNMLVSTAIAGAALCVPPIPSIGRTRLCLQSALSFVPLQLPFSPMRVFAVWIEDSRGVTIKRLQGSDTSELHRSAVLSCQRQEFGCGGYRRGVMI
jgi:hypothetical protein